MILSVRDLAVGYGAITAVRGIDLDIAPHEIVALIGPNGAGKTTLVKALAGLLPFTGDVRFRDRPIVPGSAERVLRAGLALVPEGRGILGRMSVDDNLLMGLYTRRDGQAAADLARMYERFPALAARRARAANLLSGGEQQMLAIARACLSRPALLMLDEPSLGLAPKMTEIVFDMIDELRKDGMTILLVEQKARQTLKRADRAYLMETGLVTASGNAADMAREDILTETFLGGA